MLGQSSAVFEMAVRAGWPGKVKMRCGDRFSARISCLVQSLPAVLSERQSLFYEPRAKGSRRPRRRVHAARAGCITGAAILIVSGEAQVFYGNVNFCAPDQSLKRNTPQRNFFAI